MKAIITDLDRTLLRTDKSISAYTAEVLKKCKAKGILLMAASARPLRDVEAYRSMIDFDAVTAANGAVVSLPGKKIKKILARESGEKILADLVRFSDVFLSVETSMGLYSNRDIPQWQPVVYHGFPKLPEGAELYKILASSKEQALYARISEVLTEDAYYTIADGALIQIMSREATKWHGVQQMLAYFDIAAEEAVYFGDDQDDLEPIRKCGRGVAVANAIPDVLQAADEMTAGHDEDGVAHYIHAHILSQRSGCPLIRQATAKDAARIAEIEIFNYRLNFYPIFQNDAFYFSELQVPCLVKAYQECPDQFWVYDDGAVKGFLRIEGREIKKLFVEPVLQDKGIGGKLLKFAMEERNACFLWVLEKNTRALAFYERHGFHPTGEKKLEEDTTEYLLRLER